MVKAKCKDCKKDIWVKMCRARCTVCTKKRLYEKHKEVMRRYHSDPYKDEDSIKLAWL